MPAVFFSGVSADQLFSGKRPQNLRTSIEAADSESKRILARGTLIRAKYKEGNVNASPESTVDGTLRVAHDLAQNVHMDSEEEEEEDTALFGTNIRKVVKFFRLLKR